MRSRFPLAALALTMVAAACGDDSRPPLPTQPSRVNATVETEAFACDEAGQARVREIISLLYAGKSSAKSREGNLLKFRQGMAFPLPQKQMERFKMFFDIMRKVKEDFDAGKLPASTLPLVNELFARLIVCAGFDAPEGGGDVILGVIADPTIQHTFVSSEGDYAVQTPPGMFSEPVVITGAKQADNFLTQTLYAAEYPIKTEIIVNPPGKEVAGQKSIIKVCQYEDAFADHGANRSFMRIVQRSGEGAGQVVIVLQFTTGPFLVCPENAPPGPISSVGFFSRSLALASRALRGASALAVSTFAPRDLHAATFMVDGGVGGFVDEFGSFYAGVAVPDLGVQSITPRAASPTDPTQVQFDIVVRNTGFGASPASTLRFRPTADSTPSQDIAVPVIPADSLGGAGITVTVTTQVFTLAAGSYTATATADALNAFAELNETAPTPFDNNSATYAYVAPVGTEFVVFNDLNPFDQTGMADSNNVRLVRNLVGFSRPGPRAAGNRVWFDTGRNSTICSTPSDCPANMTTMRSTIASAPGGPYTIVDVQTLPDSLLLTIPANVKVLFLWMPLQSFTAAEVTALRQFVGQGARIVFVAEWVPFYDNTVLNQLLAALNTGVVNLGGQFDPANPPGVYVNLPALSIRPHQITTALTGLRIAASSALSIGPNDIALYFNSDTTQLLSAVATIDGAVPIPLAARTNGLSVLSRSAATSRSASPAVSAARPGLRSSGLPQ